jgi:peptide/nickel transport system substrate-binding protein
MPRRFPFSPRQSRRRFVQATGAAGLGVAGLRYARPTLAQDATPGAASDLPYYEDTQGPPQPGGAVRFLLYEDPNTLNPILGSTSIAIQVVAATLEGLAENAPDGSYVPVLAAEIPTQENGGISDDLLTVTWKLREGVTWSDGTPLTSDDVKFTWEAARDAANGAATASDYELIKDIQTPDELTAVVTYSSFNAGYVDQFPWVLPRHATGDPADMRDWAFNRAPVGTGPFKLDEWSSGEFLQLSPNEHYREEGKPYLDSLIFLVVPDEAVRTAMMVEESAEIMLWSGQEADQQIEEAGVGAPRTAPGIWVVEMRFNISMAFDGDPGPEPPHPILGDIRTRQAITLGIDRNRINHELITGTVYDIDSPLDVGWMNAEVEPFTYDPEQAQALLDEVGWRDEDGDGIREAHGIEGVKDGTKLSLMMNGYTGFDTLDLIELAVQEDLKNIGMDVQIENQEFAVIFGTWEDGSPRMLGDFDILIYDSGFFAEPGGDIDRLYSPDQIPSAENPGGENYHRWVREDVGEWIQAANSSPDLNVRRENFGEVAGAIREDIITFPILQFAEGSAYSNRLHGFAISTWEWATWDSENWWVEQ